MANAEKCGRTVLICIDESRFSEEAFNYYINEIYHSGDHVICLHVSNLSPPTFGAAAFETDEWKNIVKHHDDKMHKLEQKWREKLQKIQIPDKPLILVMGGGSVGHTICEAAKEKGASLIVMASRGAGVIRRTIMGSTSDFVVHHATQPVIIVPKDHGHKEAHPDFGQQQASH